MRVRSKAENLRLLPGGPTPRLLSRMTSLSHPPRPRGRRVRSVSRGAPTGHRREGKGPGESEEPGIPGFVGRRTAGVETAPFSALSSDVRRHRVGHRYDSRKSRPPLIRSHETPEHFLSRPFEPVPTHPGTRTAKETTRPLFWHETSPDHRPRPGESWGTPEVPSPHSRH